MLTFPTLLSHVQGHKIGFVINQGSLYIQEDFLYTYPSLEPVVLALILIPDIKSFLIGPLFKNY